MKKLVLAALAALAFSPVTPVQAAPGPTFVTFEALDEVWNERNSKIHFVGLVQGESEPRQVTKQLDGLQDGDVDRCLRAAHLAMLKPGVFLFSVANVGNSGTPQCKLTRR